MKRVNEIVEGGSENLGLKKVRLVEGNGVVEKEAEEVCSNGGVVSEEVGRSGDILGSAVPFNVGSVKEFNECDFDMNISLMCDDSEEENKLAVDLNVPLCKELDDGMEGGNLRSTQRPLINEKEVNVVNIESDNSDSEVEVTGYTHGCRGKEKRIEEGMSYEGDKDLSAGLGIFSCGGGLQKFTEGEKNNSGDPWLSLRANCVPDLNHIEIDYSILNADVAEDFQTGMLEHGLAAGFEMDELEIIQAAEVLRNMARLSEPTAKRFARIVSPDLNSGKEPSVKKQPSPPLSIEQLGNCSGPFSEALTVAKERISKPQARPLIEWKPSEGNEVRVTTAQFVPSLLDLSLRALAQNAEGIESLEIVPDNLRRKLSHMLCDSSKMNVDILKILLEGYPAEICIKNSSWLTEEQFQLAFGSCQTKQLRVLQLDLCGQCMLDLAFRDILAQRSKNFSNLAIVSLRGACRLSDTGIKDLVMLAPTLQSLNLGQCTLLTSDTIYYVADSLGSNLRELHIDDCQKINAMLMLPAFKKFKCLEVLSVAGIHSITDLFVTEMTDLCGQNMKELDLANCLQLTDHSLKTIGGSCANLCSLDISNLHNLTDVGMMYLANGCRSIQKLRLCRNAFSDEAIAAFLESSGESLIELLLNNMKVGPNTAYSLAKCSRKLLSLDISWCRRITNEALGFIVDSCSSLKLLKIFGCRQITSVFINGHSNPLVRIIGLNMTPILDHVNLLEPEEVLLRYSPLQSAQNCETD